MRRADSTNGETLGSRVVRSLLIGAIRLYQVLVSPWLPRRCRFYPSCSRYAVQALSCYPVPRALALIVRRLGRCHPGNPGGVDEVPTPE